MANSYFTFKQFTIQQDQCAMKVGTDGVLLGAWADLTGCKSILDVGTGTGLIALMLAQRSLATIDAIDIDKDACEQASVNVMNSIFHDRIKVSHTSFDSFTPPEGKKYDLIISNPPYFTHSLKGPDSQRNTARHESELTLLSLLLKSKTFLQPAGYIALILPYDRKEDLFQLCKENKFYPVHETEVIPTPGSSPKRLLIEISPTPAECIMRDQLIIERARHQYTEAYYQLTKDFYLKM